MKQLYFLIFMVTLGGCTPKGPQTYSSPYIGKTKIDLIKDKGIAKDIKVFDKVEAYIYKTREEYFGKKTHPENSEIKLKPKKTYQIEHIYYINEKGIIYKYQIWKKRID